MAATETFTDVAQTTVTAGGNTAPAPGTSETWTVSSSAAFPAAATGVTQFHIADPALPNEIIAVTNVSGTTWTVTRGAGTNAAVFAHSVPFTVKQAVPAAFMSSLTVGGLSNPMTTLGDTIYENATPAVARLAGSTSARRKAYTQTGTGTVSAAPAWQEPAVDWFNVVDYGADPAGSADSASAINSAIAAAVASPAGYGTIYFPSGSYKLVSAPVSVDSNDITLRGPGRGAGVATLSAAFSSLQQGTLIMGATAVRTACNIFDLCVTGNAANNSGHGVIWRIATGRVDNLTVQKPGTGTNTFTFTATSASPAVFTATAHGYVANQQVVLSNTVAGTNSMPGGFTAGVPYYIVAPTTNTFELAQVYGGTALNSTSTGAGSVQQLSDCFHASAGDVGGHLDTCHISNCSFQNLNGGACGFYNDGAMSDSTIAHCDLDGATAVSGNWGCCVGILDQGGSNRFIDNHPFGYAYAGALFNGRNTDVTSGEYESTGNLGTNLANVTIGLPSYGTASNNKVTVRGIKTYYNTTNFSGTRAGSDILVSGASAVTVADCSLAWGGGSAFNELALVNAQDVKIHHNDAIANQFDATVCGHFVIATTGTGNLRFTIDHNHMTTSSGSAAININDASHCQIDFNTILSNSNIKDAGAADYNTWIGNDVTAYTTPASAIISAGAHSYIGANPGFYLPAVLGSDQWSPADNGLLVANMDWLMAGTTQILTGGTVYLMKVEIRQSMTWTNVWFDLQTAGVGASTGSFVGLYSSAGTLLSGSADMAASLTGTTGPKSVALSTPQALTAGSFVWVAILVNLATTQPTLRIAAPVAHANANLTAASLRFCVNGTGVTALPSPSITPASNTATGAFTFVVAGN